MTTKPVATLDWSLEVECPACKKEVDLVTVDAENGYSIARLIFGNEWDKLNDWEVTCPHCLHEFKIEKVEY